MLSLPLPPLLLTLNNTAHRHKAIIAYLVSNNLPDTATALRSELNLGNTFDDNTSKKYEGLLEKKWTSVVRLQKKVPAIPSHPIPLCASTYLSLYPCQFSPG